MNQVKNSDEFQHSFEQARANYDSRYGPAIEHLRQQLDPTSPGTGLLDENLELHNRTYVVNAFLAALNWRLEPTLHEGLPNLVPEAPVRSQDRGTGRFLDYLGCERETQDPLLVVEVKRGSAQLPGAAWMRKGSMKTSISEVLAAGIVGEPIPEEWRGWLDDLLDYVRSVIKQSPGGGPRRAIITNGDWLVIFNDPTVTFGDASRADPAGILVFHDAQDVLARADEVFTCLEYSAVLGKEDALSPTQVRYRIPTDDISYGIHALRVHYEVLNQIDEAKPHISVAPSLFLLLRTAKQRWIHVQETGSNFALQDDPDRLVEHIQEVDEAASRLKGAVEESIERELPSCSIVDHFASQHFDYCVAFHRLHDSRYFILTGESTHFLRCPPKRKGCPHHSASESAKGGIGDNSQEISTTKTDLPRCFFASGSAYHCADSNVLDQKREAVGAKNRSSCGSRSARDGEPFCEIYPLDAFLCCACCVFEEVCLASDLLRLPCK